MAKTVVAVLDRLRTVVLSYLSIREKVTGQRAGYLPHAAWADKRRPRRQFESVGQELPAPFQSLIATLAAEGFTEQDVRLLIEKGVPGYMVKVLDTSDGTIDFELRAVSPTAGSTPSRQLTLEQLAAGLSSSSDI